MQFVKQTFLLRRDPSRIASLGQSTKDSFLTNGVVFSVINIYLSIPVKSCDLHLSSCLACNRKDVQGLILVHKVHLQLQRRLHLRCFIWQDSQ